MQMPHEPSELNFDVTLQPGEALSLPAEAAKILGPGHWLVSIKSIDASAGVVRDHAAFLNSYAPEDEGLYDDYPAG
jgi:hypothetical protein